ncbi:MAG: hypothetical protein U1E76_09250 [Planctomycetota bacterium]
MYPPGGHDLADVGVDVELPLVEPARRELGTIRGERVEQQVVVAGRHDVGEAAGRVGLGLAEQRVLLRGIVAHLDLHPEDADVGLIHRAPLHQGPERHRDVADVGRAAHDDVVAPHRRLARGERREEEHVVGAVGREHDREVAVGIGAVIGERHVIAALVQGIDVHARHPSPVGIDHAADEHLRRRCRRGKKNAARPCEPLATRPHEKSSVGFLSAGL